MFLIVFFPGKNVVSDGLSVLVSGFYSLPEGAARLSYLSMPMNIQYSSILELRKSKLNVEVDRTFLYVLILI